MSKSKKTLYEISNYSPPFYKLLQEIEAIKARVKEMEEEAEKLKEMQGEVEKQMMSAKSREDACLRWI